jgi:hypothetical protein
VQNVRAVIHTETPKLPLFAGGEYTSRGGAGKRSQWDRKEKEYALGGKPQTET